MFCVKWLHIQNKYIWVKVFKNGPSKICGRQHLKNLKRYGQLAFNETKIAKTLIRLKILSKLLILRKNETVTVTMTNVKCSLLPPSWNLNKSAGIIIEGVSLSSRNCRKVRHGAAKWLITRNNKNQKPTTSANFAYIAIKKIRQKSKSELLKKNIVVSTDFIFESI